MPLHIIIVGGGIAGLAAAGYLRAKHIVTVLERGSLDFEINDYGLSVVANAFNLLVKAGVDSDRLNMVVMTTLWERNNENEEIRTIDFDTRKRFGGAPSILARRALVQAELLRFATSTDFEGTPATIVRNARVESLEVDTGLVRTADGQEFKGDVVLGADGINSVVRTAVLSSTICNDNIKHNNNQQNTQPIQPSTGRTNDLLAFMTQIPVSRLHDTKNTYLAHPTKHAGLVTWPSSQGSKDKRRLLGYHISPHELQLVGYAPEAEFSSIFTSTKSSIIHDIDPIRAQADFISDFDPSIVSLFGLSQIDAWRIRDLPPINKWHVGKAILIGDAAHAVTPHAGQGCNISIEDAEALAFVLQDIKDDSDGTKVQRAFKTFMSLRRERTQKVAAYSRYMGGLMDEEEEKTYTVISMEEHAASTYGYLGAEHALRSMQDGIKNTEVEN